MRTIVLGDDARMLWPQQDGAVLAVCLSGDVLQVGSDSRLIGRERLGSPVTALLRHGEHRVAPSAVPVGTEDGILFAATR